MEIFSIRLTQLLKENKISMYKLAKDLKLSKATISNWCYDFVDPKATDVARIARYFDVTSDYLLGLEDYSGNKIINSFNNSFNGSNNNVTIK